MTIILALSAAILWTAMVFRGDDALGFLWRYAWFPIALAGVILLFVAYLAIGRIPKIKVET